MATKDKKERVNLTIDPDLKAAFDATVAIHGKNLSNLLEEAIKGLLGEDAPDVLLEFQIAEKERELANMKEGLIEARYLAKKKQAAKKVEKAKVEVNNELEERLESYRISKYRETKGSIVTMWNNNSMNWERIVDIYEFKNKAEAKVWFRDMLVNDGAIEARY
jgi:hypothetical protein